MIADCDSSNFMSLGYTPCGAPKQKLCIAESTFNDAIGCPGSVLNIQ